ncbi:MAG: GAF domain-containing sensor histidine kinase [Arcticibacter sp.]
MQNTNSPIPENELQRLISLSHFDLDYSDREDHYKDLTLLAAKVAGTEISLVNIIDSFTQWSISSHGIDIEQMPREESVCQYTIMSDQPFEVPDFTLDERFSSKYYVQGPAGLRYYYGLPLQISGGVNIGALCVLDTQVRTLTPEKVELLAIIAESVVKRLKSYHTIELIKSKLKEANEAKKKVAHDIRGPLAGIIGLSELMAEQGFTNDPQELMEFIGMINKAGRSLLDLADEILSGDNKHQLSEHEFNLALFKDKLEKLYLPQARHKNVTLEVLLDSVNAGIPFAKNKLLQITGNLISNAIKFTPAGGKVQVSLSLEISGEEKLLKILVTDTGVGIDAAAIEKVIAGKNESTSGTMGEKGYGFGLSLVSHLVESLNGKISVKSRPGEGATFDVVLPQGGR